MEKAPQGSKEKNRKNLGKGMGSANESTGYDKHIPQFTYEATTAFIHRMSKNTMTKIVLLLLRKSWERGWKPTYEASENVWSEISCLY